ncbi:MAG: DUF6282 family protein [Bacteroidetes bacterium]|nr:DUF6282 family protein [Bacteroidota bacterium]
MDKHSKNLKKLILVCLAALLINILPVFSQPTAIDLTGIIDFHAHTGPDSRPRGFNDFETVRLAEKAGLRGIVLKNHFTMTADRAALAMTLVDNLEVFGGVALNRAVGGINPEAVRQLVRFDGHRGKVVWLPTFDSEFYVTRAGSGEPFVSVIENGAPVPGLIEVFSIIAENNLVLAMGHSSPEEALQLIPLAKEQGGNHILVTHVFGQDATMEQMQQMADKGAIMELDWMAVYTNVVSLDDYVSAISAIGAAHFLISSDFGQAENPDQATGMAAFILALMEAGINQAQIDTMARQNPAMLLELD